MRKYSIVVAALFLLALMPQANGDLIIGDLSGAGYSQGSGYSMGPGGGVNNFIAQGFTMTDTYNLTSVDLSLYLFGPQAGSTFILSIYSDNGSNAPGSDLYDLSTNVVGDQPGPPPSRRLGGFVRAHLRYDLLARSLRQRPQCADRQYHGLGRSLRWQQ